MSDADLEALRAQVRDEVLAQVAHIVTPADKMHELLLGNRQKVKALCGAWITKAPEGEVPVCRGCFDEMLRLDREVSASA